MQIFQLAILSEQDKNVQWRGFQFQQRRRQMIFKVKVVAIKDGKEWISYPTYGMPGRSKASVKAAAIADAEEEGYKVKSVAVLSSEMTTDEMVEMGMNDPG
jgi:hypothetical protein